MKLNGNTILITGGTSGIGLALAKTLAPTNNVIICGRDQTKLNELETEIPNLKIKRCDLNSQTDRDELVNWIIAQFPTLNVLINNAGIQAETNLLANTFDRQAINEQLTVDLHAPIDLTLGFLPHLRQQPIAALINVSSGLVYSPEAGSPMYAVAKAGIHAFTQTTRYQLRNTAVKVFEVLPPTVDTEMNSDLDLEAAGGAISPEETAEAIVKGVTEDTEEIRIGQVKWLYYGSRIAPDLMNRKLNEQVEKARQSAQKEDNQA